MKFYLHDTNSFNDEKITELYLEYGYEGLGLFYTVLEKLAYQEQPVKTEVLKAQLKVGKKLEKVWKFMESLGILSSNNGETFNEKLLNNSEKYLQKKEKNKKRVANFREKQKNVMRTKQPCNAYVTPSKISKDKISKDNINKVLQSSDCEVIPNLLNESQKHIKIIGLYAVAKKVEFKSKEQQTSFIKRNLRASTSLKSYELEKIKDVMRYLFTNADFKWTLESVGKYIDEDLKKLNNNQLIVKI